MVLACHCCALLLRISLPPLGSSSGVSSGVYGGVAAMLTLATTCLAAAQAQQAWPPPIPIDQINFPGFLLRSSLKTSGQPSIVHVGADTDIAL